METDYEMAEDEARRWHAMDLSVQWNIPFVGKVRLDDDELLSTAKVIENYLRGPDTESTIDHSVLYRAINLLELAEPNIMVGDPNLDAQWRGERLLVIQALRDAIGDQGGESDEVDD